MFNRRPATIDSSKALLTATAVCEYFRDQGKKVFLMTDTVTRCAMAGREVGLSLGEPPTMKGYPPSIFHGFKST